MKSDRLLSVLLLLQAKGRLSERELAEQMEVSQRTIHRDLEALSAARVPVVALRGAQGGWELQKGWRTQVPGLDETELRALVMAQPRTLGNKRLAAAAQSALDKLMASLPDPMRKQAGAMRERLHVDPAGWWETGEDLSILPAVQEATARERQLAFDYTRADGQRSLRTVDPLGLVAKGTSWYLAARTPEGMRTFRVSRMKNATVLAKGFKRPARFDLETYWEKTTAEVEKRAQRFPVDLELAPEAAQMLLERMGRTVASNGDQDLENGWVRLNAQFQDEKQARFVVLGLGASARVVRPDEFRLGIAAEVKVMAAATGVSRRQKNHATR